ncbi:MAG TPA: GIY-YIG nuclease family protein [Ramlibacter sp.]|uniref:GIY-YIG nuclease family protein n=1 Tax=Ramlibacter sp. TaxID=1917967 RepID=UPI002C4E991C|nr:GIY-YIG nuclease family protein [Ramlibacter sp.]HVZ46272.1 GIY-YIG nuclease family protein [Ramlibacter sp.]
MNRLLDIGFVRSGHWYLEDGDVRFELARHATRKNILYAFVVDGSVKYVGKTVQPLSARMTGYKRPASTQSTNLRNNALIREQLDAGASVEIFALPDTGLMHYGAFHLNLAAGLEDDIICVVNPPWNGGKVEKPGIDSQPEAPEPVQRPVHTFTFVLQPTYRRTGFFNVAVADQMWIGADGEQIELFLGRGSMDPVLGTINRTANRNRTPRIMGGPSVRKWFDENVPTEGTVQVEAYSPTSIRLLSSAEPGATE